MKHEEAEHDVGKFGYSALFEKRKISFAKVNFQKAKSAKAPLDARIIAELSAMETEGKGVLVGGSTITMKETLRRIENTVPIITEAFDFFDRMATVHASTRTERLVMEKYLNDAFRSNIKKRNFIAKVATRMQREGTCWVKTGWKAVRHRGRLLENHATADIIDNGDIMPDPSVSILEDAQHISIRRRLSYLEMKGSSAYKLDGVLRVIEENMSKDGDSLRSVTDVTSNSDYGRLSEASNADLVNKRLSVIEHWCYMESETGDREVFVISWLENSGIVVRFGRSPLESYRLPFHRIVYSERDGSLWGNSLYYFLNELSSAKTRIVRGVLDSMSNSNNGQKFVERKAMSTHQLRRAEQGAKVVMVNSVDGIKFNQFNPIPASTTNFLMFVENEMENFQGGNLKDTTMKENANMDTSLTVGQLKVSHVSKQIGDLLGEIGKDWVEMGRELMSPQQMIRLFDNDMAIDFSAIDRYAINHLQINVKTLDERFKEMREVNLALQQSKVYESVGAEKAIQHLAGRILDNLNMPEIAQETRDFVKEPSPAEQQMMAMEMQKNQLEIQLLNEQIQTEVAKRGVEARKVDALALKAGAEAQLAEAKRGEVDAKAQESQIKSALMPITAQTEIDKAQMQGDTRATKTK